MQRGNAVAQAVIGALALLAPGIAPAQIDSPSVPSMLATALLSGTRSAGIMNEARYVVGTLPAGWPIGISPAGDVSTRVRLIDSTLGSAAIVAHYAKQLVEAGWTAGTFQESYTDLFASQAFDACDTTGRHWTGTLSVVSTRANRDVSITMWLDERP